MSKCLIDGYCECNDSCEIYKCDSLKMYQQGRADRDREIAESNVFVSNKPIEDIVLEARADAIDECIQAIENTKCLFDNTSRWTMGEKDRLQNVLRQLKGEQNEM